MLATREQTTTIQVFATVGPAPGGAPAQITLNPHGTPTPGTANLTGTVNLATQEPMLIERFRNQARWTMTVLPGTVPTGTTTPDTILVPLRCNQVGPGAGGQMVGFTAKGYGPAAGGVWLAGTMQMLLAGDEGGGWLPTNDYTMQLTPDNG